MVIKYNSFIENINESLGDFKVGDRVKLSPRYKEILNSWHIDIPPIDTGVIYYVKKGESTTLWGVTLDDGNKLDNLRRRDILFLDGEEQPRKIRWYKGGKLNEDINTYDISEELIGRRVKIVDNSEYKSEAFKNDGDGYGIILKIDFNQLKRRGYTPTSDCIFTVRWSSNVENRYREIDLDLVDQIEQPRKIRWYKGGKLSESINTNDISKELIGDRVKIDDNSMYVKQAYVNNGNGYGVITRVRMDTIKSFYYNPATDHIFSVLWDNGSENSYREMDLILVDKIEKHPRRIRWYRKGKLEKGE